MSSVWPIKCLPEEIREQKKREVKKGDKKRRGGGGGVQHIGVSERRRLRTVSPLTHRSVSVLPLARRLRPHTFGHVLCVCWVCRLGFGQHSQQHNKRLSSWRHAETIHYPQCLSESRQTSSSFIVLFLPSGLQHPGGGQTGKLDYWLLCVECPQMYRNNKNVFLVIILQIILYCVSYQRHFNTKNQDVLGS